MEHTKIETHVIQLVELPENHEIHQEVEHFQFNIISNGKPVGKLTIITDGVEQIAMFER